MRSRLLGVALTLGLVLVGAGRDAQGSTYTQTRYPIVLAHGLFGFDELFGVFDYWFGIPESLRAGGARVFVTQVSAASSSVERGEQLLAQVEFIAAATGAGKVNLIGHSQGGLDVRYVMAVRPDLVASVTTVGTPHTGSPVADVVADILRSGVIDPDLAADLVERLAELIELLSGADNPQDALGALDTLTSAGAAEFNRTFPAGVPSIRCGQGAESAGGIRLYSWSGTSVLTNVFDISDALLLATSFLIGEDNDGLVGRCSSHFGRVIRDDFAMNHLDEVNQVIGLTLLFFTDPRSVFRAHANRLKNAGL